MTEWRPRSPRYDVLQQEGINVCLVRVDDQQETVVIPAELRQISLGGARMVTQRPLLLEETLNMKVTFDEVDFESIVDARVAWARPLRGEDWLIGCAFSPDLPEAMLDEMARQELIDRRKFGRMIAEIPAKYRKPGSQEKLDATVVDVSPGGLCLAVDSAEGLGAQVQIIVQADEKEFAARARVCWRMDNENSESTLIGCEFVVPKEATAMRQVLEEMRFAAIESSPTS